MWCGVHVWYEHGVCGVCVLGVSTGVWCDVHSGGEHRVCAVVYTLGVSTGCVVCILGVRIGHVV